MSLISTFSWISLILLTISILIFLFDNDPKSGANVILVVMLFVSGLIIAMAIMLFLILINPSTF